MKIINNRSIIFKNNYILSVNSDEYKDLQVLMIRLEDRYWNQRNLKKNLAKVKSYIWSQ